MKRFTKLFAALSLAVAALGLVFFAACKKAETSVTVDFKGGLLDGESSASFTMDADADLVALLEEKGFDDVTRIGYEFKGWDLPAKTGKKYAASITVAAKWSAISYGITYDTAGGELPEGTTNPSAYTVEDSFTFSAPERTGFVFDGWVDAVTEQPLEGVTAGTTGALSVKATWTQIKTAVSFYLPGEDKPYKSVTFDFEETIAFTAEDAAALRSEKKLVFTGNLLDEAGEIFPETKVTELKEYHLVLDVYNEGMVFEEKTPADYGKEATNATETEIAFSANYYTASITNEQLAGATALYYPSYYNGKPVEVILDANQVNTGSCFSALVSAYIPTNVKLIWSDGSNVNWNGLFNGAVALEKVTFGANSKLQEIHDIAMFRNTESLTSVELPDGLEYIKFYAATNGLFSGTVGLTSFRVPKALKVLPSGVIAGASALTSLIIPEGAQLTEIGSFSGKYPGVTALDFSNATKLETLPALSPFYNVATFKFPDSLTTIGGTFASATATEQNKVVTEIDLSNTKITAITSSMFVGMPALRTVKFPATLETVGTTTGTAIFGASNAVNTSITELDFSGTQLKTVYQKALAYMTALETVKFPATLETLGKITETGTTVTSATNGGVFVDSTAVRNISFNGAELNLLGDFALYGLPQLGDVSVTIAADGKMGAYVFANSGSANTVSVTIGSGATVEHSAFFFAQALTLELNGFETFGETTTTTLEDLDKLTAITTSQTTRTTLAKYPVLSGSTVKTVKFDSALTELKDFAFALSSAVPEFAKADGVTYGKYLFYKSGIESFNFENTPFKNITEKMFYGSENLKTLSGWDVLENVETGAFVGTQVTAFIIGRNLKKIDPTAFESGAVSYDISGSNPYYEKATNDEGDTEYILYSDGKSVSVFYDVKLAGDEDFERDFTETTLGLSELGNAYAGNTHLTGIKMPATITKVSEGAFANCTALVYAEFAGALETIGARAFENCTALLAFEIPTGVTLIGDNAFKNTGLTVLTADEGSELKTIGANAFDGTKLKSVDLSAATKFESFGDQAFANLVPELGEEEVFTFAFPTNATEKLTVLPDNLFENDLCLTAIEIPAYITTFAAGVFKGCTNLTSLSFASGSKMTTLGSGALSGLHIKELALPDGLETIGKAAFADMKELESVVIPAKATIGAGTNGTTAKDKGAFGSCTALTTVEFKGTDVTVPAYTFYGCTNLKTVNFENVKEIGTAAFYQTGFESITLGGISIGVAAFAGCRRLETLTFDVAATLTPGTSTTTTSQGVFAGCTQLNAVTITGEDKIALPKYTFYGCTALAVFDFSKVSSVGDACFMTAGLSGTYDFSGLTSIGKAAFAGTGVEEITLSSGVTLTDGTGTSGANYGPFGGCTSLTTVHIIKSGETLLVVPAYGFYGCTALESFDFVNVGEVGKEAFRVGSFGSTTPVSGVDLSNVTTVGDNAFYYFNLATANLASATEIGTTAFFGTDNLTSVTLKENATVGKAAFADSGLVSVQIANGVTFTGGSGNTGTNVGAFGLCTALTTVTFTEDATGVAIANYMFYGCSMLKTIDFTKIASIGSYAFSTSGITNVTLAKDTTVGSNAFEGCADLATFNLAEGVTNFEVAGFAFKNCTALTSFPFDKVTKIGSNSFEGCVSLASATFTQNVELGGSAFKNCTALAKVDFDHVTAIGTSTFEGCVSLMEAVAKPSSATGTAVAGTAFKDCTSLITVTIPEGIKSIGSNAFQNCHRLLVVINQSTTLTVTAGETTANGAVAQYAKLVISDASANTVLFKTTDENFIVLKDSAEGKDIYSVVAYIGDGSAVTLPAELTLNDGNSTKVSEYALYDYLFYKSSAITSVTLTDSVTKIGVAAFNGSAIESINIPVGCTVAVSTKLEEAVFANCANLASVTFGAATWEVPAYAFANCPKLKTFDFTKVSKINQGAFTNTGFTSLTIAATMTLAEGAVIDSGVFSKSVQLESVTFNKTDMAVPAYAFYGCTSLKTVNFENVTDIGKAAFYNTGFETLKLKSTTTLFDVSKLSSRKDTSAPFGNCTNLSTFAFIDDGRWTEIPDYLFNGAPLTKYNASDTEDVVLEGVTTIGANAFKEARFASVKIPASVTSIGSSAFQNCTLLKTVEFEAPADGTEAQDLAIGASAFNGSGITSITLPARVNSLGANVFQNCVSLQTATLTDVKIESLAAHLFNGCSLLETVYLPTTLTANALKSNAIFKNCTSLTDIWYEGEAVLAKPTASSNNKVFYGCNPFTFHVKDATKYTDNWSSQFYPTTNSVTFETIVSEPLPEPGPETGTDGPVTDTGDHAGEDA